MSEGRRHSWPTSVFIAVTLCTLVALAYGVILHLAVWERGRDFTSLIAADPDARAFYLDREVFSSTGRVTSVMRDGDRYFEYLKNFEKADRRDTVVFTVLAVWVVLLILWLVKWRSRGGAAAR